jgi:hypothetical protein
MEVKFYRTYAYGGWELRFQKFIQLPFPPFYGLGILEEEEDFTELKNSDYQKTIIYYDTRTQETKVDIRFFWRKAVSEDTIDEVLNLVENGWERIDTTNVDKLKELMYLK